MALPKLESKITASCKIRYSHTPETCTFELIEDNLGKCVFEKPQRAITPGQSAVFYENGDVLLGGVIC